VIPVLVGAAAMPRADTLPEPIRALAHRNAVGLRPERFKADCQGLVTALKEQLAEQERTARSEAERTAAEAERHEHEAQDAARMAAVEKQVRSQAVPGPGSEEFRKAEELANWESVMARGDAQALRDHMARFPRGVTAQLALTKLEELVWARLGPSPDIGSLRAFLDEFPNGANAPTVKKELATRETQAAMDLAVEGRRAEETAQWVSVAASTNRRVIDAFLAAWPSGQYAQAARARLRELNRGRLSRRALTGAAAAIVVGALWLWASAAPASLYRVVSRLPAPLAGVACAWLDEFVLYSAPRRDGLRWIDVGDPQLRKRDRWRTR
jgi:hypothetical protein